MKKTEILRLAKEYAMPVIMIVFGLVLLLDPDSAAIVIASIVGWLLMAGGLFTGIQAVLSRDKRVKRFLEVGIFLFLGSLILSNPLLLMNHLGRFLGILLAIEAGSCWNKGRPVLGAVLLLGGVVLMFAPLTASRLVFSGCGLLLIGLGLVMILSQRRKKRLEEGTDPNIIDAL